MKLNNITLLFIALLAVMTPGTSLSNSSYCNALEAKISDQIRKANYCDTDKDCTRLFAQCPFGCGDYVNVLEKGKLEMRTRKYQKDCEPCFYDCYDPEQFTLVCDTGKCQVKR